MFSAWVPHRSMPNASARDRAVYYPTYGVAPDTRRGEVVHVRVGVGVGVLGVGVVYWVWVCMSVSVIAYECVWVWVCFVCGVWWVGVLGVCVCVLR